MDKGYALLARGVLNGNRGLACDVDDTITVTSPRVHASLDRIFSRDHEDRDLTIEEMVRKYGFSGNVPQWQSYLAKKFQEGLVNDPKFYRSLPFIPGALESLTRLHERGLLSAYLPDRPGKAKAVTVHELRRFPQVPLIPKPDGLTYEDNSAWKAEVLSGLYPAVPGIIDDDQQLHERLPTDYPGVVLIFGAERVREPHGRHVYACKDWPAVERKVLELSEIIAPAYR